MDKYKALLLAILGLPETADDAAIETGAKSLGEKLSTATKAATDATKAVETMSVEFGKLRDLVTGDEKARVIAEAIKVGKLVTQSIQKLPLEALKEVVAELPEDVVHVSRRTPTGIQTHSSQVVTHGSDSAAEVCRQLGIKPEDFAKTAAATAR